MSHNKGPDSSSDVTEIQRDVDAAVCADVSSRLPSALVP